MTRATLARVGGAALKTIGIGAVVAVIAIVIYTAVVGGPDYQDFERRRADWHARCDQYINLPVTTAARRACAAELQQLLAEKSARGW